jgi:hypothetical protein
VHDGPKQREYHRPVLVFLRYFLLFHSKGEGTDPNAFRGVDIEISREANIVCETKLESGKSLLGSKIWGT